MKKRERVVSFIICFYSYTHTYYISIYIVTAGSQHFMGGDGGAACDIGEPGAAVGNAGADSVTSSVSSMWAMMSKMDDPSNPLSFVSEKSHSKESYMSYTWDIQSRLASLNCILEGSRFRRSLMRCHRMSMLETLRHTVNT